MNQEKNNKERDFTISFDDKDNPTVMAISIPIKRCADDIDEGSLLLRGGFEEIKQLALQIMRNMRARKKQSNGIIKPSIIH